MSTTPRTDAFFAGILNSNESHATDILSLREFACVLERERDELAAWKESALEVERRWDEQGVAKLLGIRLGQDIRPNIEPKIRELLADRARLDSGMIRLIHHDELGYRSPTVHTQINLRAAIDAARVDEVGYQKPKCREEEQAVADSMRQAPGD